MDTNKRIPPKLGVRFLLWFLKKDLAEEVEGDLEEQFYKQLHKTTPFRAKLNYWYQVFNYLRPFAIRNLNLLHLNPFFMYRNYFKIAIRNLSKNSIFSAIHILGLAIGAAACLLIFQYIHFERSYDQFHEQAENIYRVPIRYSEGFGNFPKTASNHPGLGPAMQADFPEVQSFTRFFHPKNMGFKLALSSTNEAGRRVNSTEDKTYLADSTFFHIFSFPFLAGDRRTALNQPGSIVLSASMAKKYFGEEDPIDKVLRLNGRGELTVTGVFKDVPENSHLDFNALISFNTVFSRISPGNLWIWPEFYTYVLLKPGTAPETVEAKFPAFTKRYMAEIHEEHNFQTYFSLQPLSDIHLKTDCSNEPSVPGSERMVYFLSILGVFILIIAWVNYINLSTSRSIERAKEVGIRKVVGAHKGQLRGQFLMEAILLNGLGMLLGLLLARIFLPNFTKLVGKDIGDSLLNVGLLAQPLFWLILLGSIILGGVIAGIYPAMVLSSFRPVQVLKGRFHKSSQGVSFRKVLVGFQFVLSILLIAATLLVTQQLTYMNKKELGYNKEQILVLKAPLIRDSTTTLKIGVFNSELLQYPMINSITKSSEIPGKLISFRGETRKAGLDKEANIPAYYNNIDHQFLPTFNIPLVAGKNFALSDSSTIFNADNNKVLINEKLAESFGYQTPDEAIGEDIKFKLGPIDHQAKIIGIVKNYHQRSLKEAYDPILYYYPTYDNSTYYSLNINTTDWSETIALVEKKYRETFVNNSFEYFFLDEFFDRQYRADQQFSKVCKLMAGLAIFVACLGFFGLSALILIQRTKEIGIRRILGANSSGIMLLVTKDFMIMLALAKLIAIPLIIYFGRQWLNNFAFNTGLGWQVFTFPVLFLLLIVFTIVGVQIYRTSVLNPIHSLRHE